MRTLLTNGHIVTASEDFMGDILIEGETIAATGIPGAFAALQTDVLLDAGGKYIFPGAIDVHTHMELPPPLRRIADNEALWLGLQRRELQVVSTDHAAFNFAGQKELGRHDFSRIPNGLPGVEHRDMLLYKGVRSGKLDLQHFVDLIATRPAQLFGLFPRKGTIAPGSDADLVIFDRERSMTLSATKQHQRVDYTPFEGMQVQGVPEIVLLRGRVIVRHGEYNGGKGGGQYLPRQTFTEI